MSGSRGEKVLTELDMLKLQFLKTDEKHCSSNYYYWHCSTCFEASGETEENVAKINGRKESFKAHLKRCLHQVTCATQTTSTLSGSKVANTISSSNSMFRPTKMQQLTPYLDQGFLPNQIKQLKNLLAEFIADNGISFHCVERESTSRLFRIIRGTAADNLPGRKKLVPILKGAADASIVPRMESFERDVQNGRIITVVLDGWESKNKKHITGVVLQSDSKWVTFSDDSGNYDNTDVHDELVVAREIECIIDCVENKFPNLKCRAICTDDAGQYGRAHRILAKHFPHWVFVHCFAHQVNLIVKDVLKQSYGAVVEQDASVVSKINKSSSNWLIRAKNEMKRMYGKHLALLSLMEVRWNSAQSMMASLLRVKSALKSMHSEYEDSNDFPNELQLLGDNAFWKKIADS